MARATLAPVIGSPASWSQKIVCRYSSSATVACCSGGMCRMLTARLCVQAPGERLHLALGQREELARGRREVRVAAGDEGERLVQGWVERRDAELAPEAAGGEHG